MTEHLCIVVCEFILAVLLNLMLVAVIADAIRTERYLLAFVAGLLLAVLDVCLVCLALEVMK